MKSIRNLGIILGGLVFCALSMATLQASDSQISVHQMEIRATVGGMRATGGYARIENTGNTEVTLVGLTAAFAEKAEIHTMISVDGVMKMRRLEAGLPVPAGGHALMMPGGVHLMFIGLKAAMPPESMHEVTLYFDQGDAVTVIAHVKKPADIKVTHNH